MKESHASKGNQPKQESRRKPAHGGNPNFFNQTTTLVGLSSNLLGATEEGENEDG